MLSSLTSLTSLTRSLFGAPEPVPTEFPPSPPMEDPELALLEFSEASPRFDVCDPAMLAYLDENGYAVVKDVVGSAEELVRLRTLLWRFLESNATGWREGCPETWSDEGMCKVGSAGTGILWGNGVGHSDFLWAARTLPAVKAAFAQIWGTDDLITSFDGGNVFRPWDSACPETEGRKTRGGWWHVDQGRTKLGARHAVQGLVSLFDAGPASGGLCVVPGSHARHAEVVELFGPKERDFVMVIVEPMRQPTFCVKNGRIYQFH